MVEKEEGKEVNREVSNIQLRWKCDKDKPAIKAVQEVAEELDVDGSTALRWICEHTKKYAIKKAKEVKALLIAS